MPRMPVEAADDPFWDQFFSETLVGVQDFFTLIPAAEIRALREESPSNLATLCYKAVEKLLRASESSCGTQLEQQIALNCVRLLTRILPYIFEDPEWRGFFWSTLPGQQEDEEGEAVPLAQSLLNAVSDLSFCPDFTVASSKKSGPDVPEDLQSIDSCEYIWEAGVGFAHSPPKHAQNLSNRSDLLKLLLTCFSETMYLHTGSEYSQRNRWIGYFTSAENRHALPLFTSLLNTVCAYDPVGYGIPYNHLMFTDYAEPLVETALQVLVVTLDHDYSQKEEEFSNENNENLFMSISLSRIHAAEEDFARVPMSIPMFTGTLWLNLLIIVFHKIITTGHQRLQPLFDCLLTIIVNISPYLKTLSMVASTKLLHLLEAFSTPWFLFSSPTNHHLVFFLLEVFNNIIQYQFDGNSSLVYTIIRKRNVFHQLVNLPTDGPTIAKTIAKKGKKLLTQGTVDKVQEEPETMEGAMPAKEAEPGTLKVSLAATPAISKMTEQSHPTTTTANQPTLKEVAENAMSIQEGIAMQPPTEDADESHDAAVAEGTESAPEDEGKHDSGTSRQLEKSKSLPTPPASPTYSVQSTKSEAIMMKRSDTCINPAAWVPTCDWVLSWKQKLPLQTIMRMLQVLVPQVEKICIDKGLTDESEILKFLQHGTLVGLLPVPHPILIRKYQANQGTSMWFRTYMWGVIYLRYSTFILQG
ncbi:PREDICTED: protein HID1-like [Priapulus caudatus]|uniref:Protein HID1-like n=1 Tax=Priapulus caudatus TaxID=37621 RepID=A0ABM1DVZ3_PRICU|nr:PREDICTED: protein HID1-like [Priapulus caudatus]